MPGSSDAVPLRVVIVGGVAGGASAAARLRRLNEHAEIIVLERGPHASFANCGLPYYLGGEIAEREKLLVAKPVQLQGWLRLDVRTGQEAVAIDRADRRVRVRSAADAAEYDLPYDYLILAPGAAPIRPAPLLAEVGADHPRVLSLRSLPDVDRIKGVVDAGVRRAMVVGGGFIGLEVAEQLVQRGVATTLVELLPQVMPPLDPEVAAPLAAALVDRGVDLRLGRSVERLSPVAGGDTLRAALSDGALLDADLVLLAIGVRPDTDLAQRAGLAVNARGAIVVDAQQRTSDPRIYAVGDAVEIAEPILGGRTQIPLAGPANRQGRLAADHLSAAERQDPVADALTFRGALGTSVVRVFDCVAGSTGYSQKALERRGWRRHEQFESTTIHANHHAGYYPGAQRLTLKIVYERPGGRLLGAQAVGGAGVDKRLDVLAMALQMNATVFDLVDAELAYAPPFGSAKDPINMAGFQAANLLQGMTRPIDADELAAWLAAPPAKRPLLLDVRTPAEFEAGAIPGAINVPLDALRERLAEVDLSRPLVTYCAVGMRGYNAERILRQRGAADVRNLAGGYTSWRRLAAAASPGDV